MQHNVVGIKIFVILCCFTVFYNIIIMLTNMPLIVFNKNQEQKAPRKYYDSIYSDLKKNKFILLWNSPNISPLYYYENGQIAFVKNNCTFINCYVTTDKQLLDNITKFHAIAFNGRNINSVINFLPSTRSTDQLYIYFDLESADNNPVCDEIFDGFFNWTSTYRLDSDLPIPYIAIKNKKNELVGPRKEMHWEDLQSESTDMKFETIKHKKSKAAAWFVSACKTRSNRTIIAKALQSALAHFDMELSIFGTCGDKICPRYNSAKCLKMLEENYYFYLAFENSLSEDYVTEKILMAMQHNTIPIVLGGADYARFLPPGSYIHAYNQTPEELAALMHNIIHSPSLYQSYFKWKDYYKYMNAATESNEIVCNLCAALNDGNSMSFPNVYQDFRKWWYPNFRKRCNSLR